MLLALLAFAVLLVAAPAAQAAFGIESFEAKVTTVDESDTYDQAGGHPHFGITDILFNTTADGSPDGNVKDLRVDPPAGLVSNPQALPQCTEEQRSGSGCPPETQLGTEEITAFAEGVFLELKVPFYNMTFDETQVSRFGFNPEKAGDGLGPLPTEVVTALGALHPVDIIGGVRWQSDYGVFFTISDTGEQPEVISSKLKFFAVPASAEHDTERGEACLKAATVLPPLTLVDSCNGGGQASSAPTTPFLTNPTRCPEQKLMTRLTAWSHAGEVAGAESFTTTRDDGGEGPANCGPLPFAPSISLTPDVTQPDSPAGPQFNLHVPTDGLLTAGELSTSHVKDVNVTLPAGMTLNPSAANGLAACTDAQLGLGTSDPVACPATSQIGTVAVRTPLLPNPLAGTIYVGQPQAGNQFRMFLTAEGHGVSLRLKGSVKPDPTTGQLTVTFTDNPQQAFEDFTLDTRKGPRAPLATPLDCGSKTASSVLTPYSGNAAASPASSFDIAGDGCPAPFQPSFAARTSAPSAGAFAPFGVNIARADRQQFLSGVAVRTPPGLGGAISRVEQCPDALAAQGNCPAGSRIGTATTASGAGSEPFSLSGPVYLTGPYKGAPFGMAIVIRALAGPYDLGTVVVREAIFVDVNTAQVTVVSDPLPTILEGVPIRLRIADVAIDREGFVYNPTSCGPKDTGAQLQSTQGTAIDRSAGFEIADCAALAFKPTLAMRLTGGKAKKKTKKPIATIAARNPRFQDGGHPGITATVTQNPGEANIKSVKVTLPLALALDPDNAQELCEFEAGLKGDCPKGSIVGTATAVTPILNQPLTGPVYFVKNVRFNSAGQPIRTLPTLLVKLKGEVEIWLRGKTSVDEKGRLVSTFDTVPDAPVKTFTLRMNGGNHGILVVTHNKDVCKTLGKTFVRTDGQNGKADDFSLKIQTPCHLQVIRRQMTKKRMRVTVGGLRGRPGKVRISGRSLLPKSATVKAAQSAVLTTRLTAYGRRQHRRGGRVPVRVTFTPKGGKPEAVMFAGKKRKR